VAFFPDSFHEVNGVAHTSRHLCDFARRNRLPLLCIRAGPARSATHDGALQVMELPRGVLTIPLESDLGFDPACWRHLPRILARLRDFRPDLIHITGPSDMGLMGAFAARLLRIPLAASWHTNIHEYAAARAAWLGRLCGGRGRRMRDRIERGTMTALVSYYRRADLLFAPNLPLCSMLERRTGRPCHVMARGVDCELFSPAHRGRSRQEGELVVGFVGRLSREKNVSTMVPIARQLRQRGLNFRLLIVGQGSEQGWLRARLPEADFPGILRGAELARAYADMDVFLFPSHTDTFGNAVLEAMASGVPAIVTPDGGPACLVRDGETGLVREDGDLAAAVERLAADPALCAFMRRNARRHALQFSWSSVFTALYAQYRALLPGGPSALAT
jgi:glycosyltransferase involved in cell wall biosynthesis